MSMAEFLGNDSGFSNDAMALPSAPKQRGPDDDGSFRRKRRDDDSGGGFERQRSDEATNWRRGPAATPSEGFRDRDRDRNYGMNDRDRGRDSMGGGSSRFGGGGFGRDRSERSGFGDRNERSGFGSGGGFRDYDRDRDHGRGGDFGRSSGGYSDREPPTRPRLALSKRTTPLPKQPKRIDASTDFKPETIAKPNKPKANPFGSAKAVDTQTRLEQIEKEKMEKVNDEASTTAATNDPDTDMNKESSTVDNTVASGKDATEKASTTDVATSDDNVMEEGDKETNNDNNVRKERKQRQPKVINTRAAALEAAAAPDNKRELSKPNPSGSFSRRPDTAPPPVINKRFEQLALEDKDYKQRDNRDRDRDRSSNNNAPLPVNSRFSAAVDIDRDRDRDRDRDQRASDPLPRPSSPPKPVESRFASAAAADRSYKSQSKSSSGPPPVMNSRFSSIAGGDGGNDLDYSRNKDMDYRTRDYRDRDNAPLPERNSRFASAAAMDRDYNDRTRERTDPGGVRGGDRDRQSGGMGREDDRFGSYGGSRDRMRDDRGGYGRDRYENRGMGYGRDRDRDGGRFGNDRGFGGASRFSRDDYNHDRRISDRGGYSKTSFRGDRGDDYQQSGETEKQTENVSRTTYKPSSSILGPKTAPPAVPPPVAPPLTLPGEDEEAAKLRIERQKREAQEKIEAEKKAAEAAALAEAEAARLAAEATALAEEKASSLLAEFSSGNKLGDELSQWCKEQGALLPPVVDLVYHLLCEKERKNPSINCEWGNKENFGCALLELVEDDVLRQMQVLFGIQKYCESIGFPKLDKEYVIQGMFRSMYRLDLALDDAFEAWKEDESEAYESGKGKAIIQTMDWFNWLEEDDEDEDYSEEEDL